MGMKVYLLKLNVEVVVMEILELKRELSVCDNVLMETKFHSKSQR
jgi:hypothetical protein